MNTRIIVRENDLRKLCRGEIEYKEYYSTVNKNVLTKLTPPFSMIP